MLKISSCTGPRYVVTWYNAHIIRNVHCRWDVFEVTYGDSQWHNQPPGHGTSITQSLSMRLYKWKWKFGDFEPIFTFKYMHKMSWLDITKILKTPFLPGGLNLVRIVLLYSLMARRLHRMWRRGYSTVPKVLISG